VFLNWKSLGPENENCGESGPKGGNAAGDTANDKTGIFEGIYSHHCYVADRTIGAKY